MVVYEATQHNFGASNHEPRQEPTADQDLRRLRARSSNRPKQGQRQAAGKNCRLVALHGGEYAIRYYSTDVVTWHRDGTLLLTTRTWQTPSTRDWMETAAPVLIRQDKGVWYVRLQDQWQRYYNGMRIDPVSQTHRLAG
jgi:hypothetical protein